MKQKATVKFVKKDGKTINYSQSKFRRKINVIDLFSKKITEISGNITVTISSNVESVTFENCIFERGFKLVCNNPDTEVNFLNCTFGNDRFLIKCYFENGNVNFEEVNLTGGQNSVFISAENLNEFNISKYQNSEYYLSLTLSKIKKVNISKINGKSNLYIKKTEEINLRNIDIENNETLELETSILNMSDIQIWSCFFDVSLYFDTISTKNTKIMTSFSNIILPNATYKKLLTDEMINSELEKSKISLLSVLKGYRNKINAINAKQEEKINSEIDSIYNPKIEQLQKQIKLEKERASLAKTYTKKALNKRKVGSIKK